MSPHVVSWVSGNGAEWATVVVALAALIAASIAAWRSHELQSELNALERERKRDEDRAQAEKVAVWLENVSPSDSEQGGDGWRLMFRNASDLPVYGVSTKLQSAVGDRAEFSPITVEVLPPGRRSWPLPGFELLPLEGYTDSGKYRPTMETVGDIQLELRFRDSAGRCWQRDADSSLRPQDS